MLRLAMVMAWDVDGARATSIGSHLNAHTQHMG